MKPFPTDCRFRAIIHSACGSPTPHALIWILLTTLSSPLSAADLSDVWRIGQGMVAMMRLWAGFMGAENGGLSMDFNGRGPAQSFGYPSVPPAGRPQAWPNPWRPPVAAARPYPSRTLTGIWRSVGGEVLLIKEQRFRLHSASRGTVDGVYRLSAGRFLAKTTRDRRSLTFLFERRGERIVLLSRPGQALVFDRVPGTARL